MNPLHLIFTAYAEKFGLTIQSERSFKLHIKQIETGTLYAFDPLELPSSDQLFELTSLLGFNETTNISIAKNLSEANLIGISIPDLEQTPGCNFYLEFWDKVLSDGSLTKLSRRSFVDVSGLQTQDQQEHYRGQLLLPALNYTDRNHKSNRPTLHITRRPDASQFNTEAYPRSDRL